MGFFEIPDVFRELCFIRVFLIPKRFWVVSVCHSEFVGCHSNILLCFCLSVVVTSAWYIMLVAKQFSGIGHSSFLRQLYLFWVGALFGYAFESICGCCVRLWQLSCLAYSCSWLSHCLCWICGVCRLFLENACLSIRFRNLRPTYIGFHVCAEYILLYLAEYFLMYFVEYFCSTIWCFAWNVGSSHESVDIRLQIDHGGVYKETWCEILLGSLWNLHW